MSPTFAPRSILICNIRLIGDVVLTTALVGLLKRAYPEATIDVLVNRGTGEFLEKDWRIGKILFSEKWQKGVSLANNAYLLTIARRYDMAICLNAADRGTLATILAGKHIRIGYYEADKPVRALVRKALLSHPLVYNLDEHPVLRCRNVARILGIPDDAPQVQIFWDEGDRQQVASTLRTTTVESDYFVLHPFARWRYKYWDIRRFVEVSDHIAQRYGLRPIWTSSPDTEEKQQLVAAAASCRVPPHLIAGSLSLNQMACLLQGARLYVGLDTAITHIAASTGVPTVALYGPTEIWRWHPWDNKGSLERPVPVGYRGDFHSGNVVALQAACEHYPCIRPRCYRSDLENPCMMALSVEKVCAEIDRLMQTDQPAT